MRDPLATAFAEAVRPVFQAMLDEYRAGTRADMRKMLAELRTDDEGPDVGAFDTRGAAMYLSVSERTIARMRADGRLPYSRIGRQVRFRREDLDQYLASSIES